MSSLTFNHKAPSVVKPQGATIASGRQIVILIEDQDGNEFSTVTIDPNTINLNPNRVPLRYSATLYTPIIERGGNGYTVQIQVFGNYE